MPEAQRTGETGSVFDRDDVTMWGSLCDIRMVTLVSLVSESVNQ